MPKLIAIDSGHGMETAGKRTPALPYDMGGKKQGEQIREKEWNRAVADKAITALLRCGFEVLDVSPGTKDVPVADRIAAANKARADYFISFHYNAAKGVWWAGGYAVAFVFSGAGEATRAYANAIQGAVGAVLPWQNNGVASDKDYMGHNLAVLRQTTMPAVLLETGFMDVLAHAEKMLDANFQASVAEAVAKGMCAHTGVAYIAPAASGGAGLDNLEFIAIQLGAYKNADNAKAALDALKRAGYPDAYAIVKDTKAKTYRDVSL